MKSEIESTGNEKKPRERKINPPFDWGEIVYLISDYRRKPRTVIGFFLSPGGVKYTLRHADDEPTEHFLIEITDKITDLDGLPKPISDDE